MTPTQTATIDPASLVRLTLEASERYAIENCASMPVAVVTVRGKAPERVDIITPDQAANLRKFADALAVTVDFEIEGKSVGMRLEQDGSRFRVAPKDI